MMEEMMKGSNEGEHMGRMMGTMKMMGQMSKMMGRSSFFSSMSRSGMCCQWRFGAVRTTPIGTSMAPAAATPTAPIALRA